MIPAAGARPYARRPWIASHGLPAFSSAGSVPQERCSIGSGIYTRKVIMTAGRTPYRRTAVCVAVWESRTPSARATRMRFSTDEPWPDSSRSTVLRLMPARSATCTNCQLPQLAPRGEVFTPCRVHRGRVGRCRPCSLGWSRGPRRSPGSSPGPRDRRRTAVGLPAATLFLAPAERASALRPRPGRPRVAHVTGAQALSAAASPGIQVGQA